MNERDVKTRLGRVPNSYNPQELQQIVSNIERMFNLILQPGEITVSQIYATDLPTDPTDLKKGQLWYDEDERIVRIA